MAITPSSPIIDAPKSETYRIIVNGQKAGGVVINIDRKSGIGHLDLLFTLPEVHSKGIGYAAWTIIEGIHPDPNDHSEAMGEVEDGFDGMFRFQKVMTR